MVTLFFMILMFGLVGNVVGFAFRLSWGLVKMIFGLFTFALFPVILIVVLAGQLFAAFLPVIIIGAICYAIFKRN